MLKVLRSTWKKHSRYKTFAEMPSGLVAFFASTGSLVAGGYSYILHKTMPGYLEVVDTVPISQWGWKGWYVTLTLLMMGISVRHFASVSLRCGGLLRDRWYK